MTLDLESFIFGIRPLSESLDAGKLPDKVLIQKGLQGNAFHQLFGRIRSLGIPYQVVPQERLNRLTRKNHQGVIAFMPLIEYQKLEHIIPALFEAGETPLLLVLDGVTDVRNLGAVARSAECAGAHALVIPQKGSATVTADAIKTSAGALSKIPVCREPNLLESIAFLQACGVHTLVCDDSGRTSIYEEDLDKPLALIMGSEDKGVSPAVRKVAGKLAVIPMKGTIASLNVAVATGVALFEAIRQRGGGTRVRSNKRSSQR